MNSAYEGGALPGGRNELDQEAADFLRMARSAVEKGQFRLAASLYLAAFERDCASNQSKPSPATVAGMRKAWTHACDLKDRTLVEHIFERLEPHLPPEIVSEYTRKLHALSLEKLEEFGFSHDDMEEMADFLTNVTEMNGEGLAKLGFALPQVEPKTLSTVENELVSPSAPYGMRIDPGKPKSQSKDGVPVSTRDSLMGEETAAQQINYHDLASYGRAIEDMKHVGIAMRSDARFAAFMDMLSRRHGIDPKPSAMPLVFRAQAREDATYFMHATVGELRQPSIRVHMDTTSQGVSMLSISATSEFKSRQQFMQMGFDHPAVLVLEDVDLWAEPLTNLPPEEAQAAALRLEHGVREAIMMIRSAIMNPKITVMASCGSEATVDSLFFGVLEPATVIDIDIPNTEERTALWKWLSNRFPSLRYLDLDELTRLTESLTRYDICSAAGDAVDQAYHESVTKRAYVPVTKENLYEKIAACQPLESAEYLEIQEQAIESFRKDLDHLDEFLNGEV